MIGQLRHLNDTLEQQVKTRTAELEITNENMRFFYSQLSHDMRNKLFSLDEIGKLLAKDLESQQYDDLGVYASRRQVSIRALQDMVSDILTLKIIAAGQHSPVVTETIALKTWLQDIISIYKFNANRRRVKVHLLMAEGLPPFIVTDAVKLDKILSNLVGNAVKYANTLVKVMVSAEGGRLKIKVKDNGQGIAQKDMGRLFDKNFTGGAGTGLGLYIARWLCDILEIKITVESTPDKGSSFLLDAPLVIGSPEQVRAPEQLPEPGGLEGRRILIADDDFNNRFVLAKNLQRAGYLVAEAENGEQMLHLATAQKPDLILMDNQMPVMSELQALEVLRADPELRDIRVVLMTASSTDNDHSLLQADADDFITKPMGMQQLKRVLSRLLPGHQQCRP